MNPRRVGPLALLLVSISFSSGNAGYPPPFIHVVGTNGFGAPDPGFIFASAIPVALAPGEFLIIDFSRCVDLKLCTAEFDTPSYTYRIACAPPSVTITALLAPVVGTIQVVGASFAGTFGLPGNAGPCADFFLVPVGGGPVFLGSSAVIIYDKNGAPPVNAGGVSGIDASLVFGDVLRVPLDGYVARSDHDENGVLGGVDLSLMQAIVLLGRSSAGCNSGVLAQPYCP